MTRSALLTPTIIALLLVSQGAQSAPSISPSVAEIVGTASDEALHAFAARRGASGAANVNRGANVNRNANFNKNANFSNNKNINKNTNINRNTNVNKNTDLNRNVNANINRNIIVRPVQPWVRRPYYGTVIAGITLGTIIAVSSVPWRHRRTCVGFGRIRLEPLAIGTIANRWVSDREDCGARRVF